LFASDGDDSVSVQVGDTIFQTYPVLPDAVMRDVAEEHGFRVRAEEDDMTVQEAFDMHFLGRPSVGDKITYDRAVMIVRECNAGDVKAADIVVEAIQSKPDVSAARALFNRFVRPPL
jgi:cell volume regulation protein A